MSQFGPGSRAAREGPPASRPLPTGPAGRGQRRALWGRLREATPSLVEVDR